MGAIVGLAFVPVQAAMQSELRRQGEQRASTDRAQAEQRELLLQISLRNDLPGIDLHGRNLAGTYLFAKNLTGANLRGANLRRADLRRADLTDADLTGAHFDGANLQQARLAGATLAHTSFRRADLTGARISGYEWRGRDQVKFHFTIPLPALRAVARVRPAPDFSGANLFGARISRIDLSYASFHGAVLDATEFTDAVLERTNFDRARISAGFERVSLCNASFHGARFDGTWFADVNLRHADLRDALFADASFFRADFRGSDGRGIRIVRPEYAVFSDSEPLFGSQVTVTGMEPELPPPVARALDASQGRALPPSCSWALYGHRLHALWLEARWRRTP